MALIYLSSTFTDLKDYRAAVYHALRQLGHDVKAMEDYVATDERPVGRCLQDVAECDLYIGILAWRYGYIPVDSNPAQKSVTELEYKTARELGHPCLLFVLDQDAQWQPRHMDACTGEGDRGQRILEFRAAVERDHLRSQFQSPTDLAQQVTAAVACWQQGRAAGQAVDIGIDHYFASIRRRFQRLDLEALTPSALDENARMRLQSIFVEPTVREKPTENEYPEDLWDKLHRHPEGPEPSDPSEGFTGAATAPDAFVARTVFYERPPRPVLDVLADEKNRRLVILGNPGSGKSTLVKYVMLALADPNGDVRLRSAMCDYVPVFVELRHYAANLGRGVIDSFLGFLEYLAQTEGLALGRKDLEKYLDGDGRALIIFDGLDEVLDSELRDQVAHLIDSLAARFPKPKLLITSRTVSYSPRVLADSGFVHYTLQDFDASQVRLFLERWYGAALPEHPALATDRRERVLAAYAESKSIRQLAGNPMLLTIMAIIGKNQELPHDRWKLYDHAASVLIQRWDLIRHIQKNRPGLQLDGLLGEDDKKELLRRIASTIHGSVGDLGGIYIEQEVLEAQFREYVMAQYKFSHSEGVAVARTMIEIFHERNFILCLYAPGLHGFVHRAFLEFFCAWDIVQRFERKQEIGIEYITSIMHSA